MPLFHRRLPADHVLARDLPENMTGIGSLANELLIPTIPIHVCGGRSLTDAAHTVVQLALEPPNPFGRWLAALKVFVPKRDALKRPHDFYLRLWSYCQFLATNLFLSVHHPWTEILYGVLLDSNVYSGA